VVRQKRQAKMKQNKTQLLLINPNLQLFFHLYQKVSYNKECLREAQVNFVSICIKMKQNYLPGMA